MRLSKVDASLFSRRVLAIVTAHDLVCAEPGKDGGAPADEYAPEASQIADLVLKNGRIEYAELESIWWEGGLEGVEHLARVMIDELNAFAAQPDLTSWTPTEFQMLAYRIVDVIGDVSPIGNGARGRSDSDEWSVGFALASILISGRQVEDGDLRTTWPALFEGEPSRSDTTTHQRLLDALNALVAQNPS